MVKLKHVEISLCSDGKIYPLKFTLDIGLQDLKKDPPLESQQKMLGNITINLIKDTVQKILNTPYHKPHILF